MRQLWLRSSFSNIIYKLLIYYNLIQTKKNFFTLHDYELEG